MIPDWHKNLIRSIPTDIVPDFWDDYDPERLGYVLGTLTPREERVIRLRFEKGMTLEATGLNTPTAYGSKNSLSKERIRQIQNRALRKLKHPSRMQCLHSSCPLPPPDDNDEWMPGSIG